MSAVILHLLSTHVMAALQPLFSHHLFLSSTILHSLYRGLGLLPLNPQTTKSTRVKGLHCLNMEASQYGVKAHNLPPSLHKQKPTLSFLPFHQNLKLPSAFEGKGQRTLRLGSPVPCAKQGSVIESQLGLGSEMDSEWKEMGMWNDNKCQDKGMVELLECLEREAIMGEDEGREPTDYNRRAKIFSESARVFRALKEGEIPSHHS